MHEDDERPPARFFPKPGELPTAMSWGGLDRIATEAQNFMAQVEQSFGANAKIGVVAMVAEVNGEAEIRAVFVDPEETDPDEKTIIPYSSIDWRCSDHRRWIQRALFDGAARSVGAWR